MTSNFIDTVIGIVSITVLDPAKYFLYFAFKVLDSKTKNKNKKKTTKNWEALDRKRSQSQSP